MKKILLVMLLVGACSGKVVPLPDAEVEKLPLEMCADFRNTICSVSAKCGKLSMDECISIVDGECTKVLAVTDPKRLYGECIPELNKLTCDKLELPKSCEDTFIRRQ